MTNEAAPEPPTPPEEAAAFPVAGPQEAALDIHKPKPVHSWRELLGEIGVIVIGVMIALAGEQAVEWLHWQHEMAETREALNVELKRATGSYAYRMRHVDCESRRLAELQHWLDHSHAGEAMKTARPIGTPSAYVISRGTWEVAKTGQAAAHIPLGERLHYAHLYDVLSGFNDALTRSSEIWRNLNEFGGPEPLDHQDRMRLQGLVRAAARGIMVMKTYPEYFDPEIAALGIKPEVRRVFDVEGDRSFCQPLFAR